MRSWSITRTLMLWHVVSASVLLLASNLFLYWALAVHLKQENAQLLADDIHELRAMLREDPADTEEIEEEIHWEGSAGRFPKRYIEIQDERKRSLLKTPGMEEWLDAEKPPFPDPLPVNETFAEPTSWKADDGRTYLLASAMALSGKEGKLRRVICLALDISHQEKLLAKYRRKLLEVLALGILFSAVSGALIVKRGMKPLEHIAEAVQRVTVSQLHERIRQQKWPRELAVLASAFDDMLNRLEESFSRLSQFSADLAHELRTPIQNLRGETEVALTKSRHPEEYRQIFESNLEEYDRLARMIDNLLFLARAENAETVLQKSLFDVRPEIQGVSDFHEAMAKEKGLEIRCRGDAKLMADAQLFRRAISNVLSNAIRYSMNCGFIEIGIEMKDNGAVEIRVEDQGIGIAPEHLSKIFDRFYRVDPARSHETGVGLGLSIVRSIMTLHQGSISIQSVPSQGSKVTLHFPAV